MMFDRWFVQQFGKRPSKNPSYELQEKVRDLESMLWAARDLRDQCDRWDAQYQSASYAWKIQDKYKG